MESNLVLSQEINHIMLMAHETNHCKIKFMAQMVTCDWKIISIQCGNVVVNSVCVAPLLSFSF